MSIMNKSERKMSKMTKTAILLLLSLVAMNVAVAANFPVGTHLVKGTLKDWQNKVLTSSAAVTIQAVATNGSIIASTKVADPSADGYNFLLQIPLSSKATDSTAAVSNTLNCVIVQESGLSLAQILLAGASCFAVFSCQSREGNYVDGIHGSTE